jgi:hypothetical protein
MKKMKDIMNRLFENQPREIAGFPVLEVRDYRGSHLCATTGRDTIDYPSDVLFFLLKGNQRLWFVFGHRAK